MSIEAMKQALEALEEMQNAIYNIGGEHVIDLNFAIERADVAEITITSLRQAIQEEALRNVARLGQEIEQEPVAWLWELTGEVTTDPDRADGIWQPLYTHPPKQESVVYELSPTDIYDFAGWLTTRKGLMQVGGAYEAGPMAEAVGEYLKTYPERFTAKPKREWVGLTDEDKQIAFDDTQEASGGFWEFADAIEAKLKTKNGFPQEEKNG